MSERAIRGVPVSVWALRAVVVAGFLVATLAGAGQGYAPPVPAVVVVVLGALVSAYRPEALVVSGTMALVLLIWAFQLHGAVPGSTLVAAAGLVVVHVAATLLAYGPPTLPVARRLALLWVARGAMVWLGSAVVWVVAAAYDGHDTPEVFWLAGLASAVAAAVSAGLVLAPRGVDAAPGRETERRATARSVMSR